MLWPKHQLSPVALVGLATLCMIIITWSFTATVSAETSLLTKNLPLNYFLPIDIKPVNCDLQPDPKVSLTGREKVTVRGTTYVCYYLSVDNRTSYPDSLFAPAPQLPPCGKNTSSARTWVNIVDQDDQYIYGFCALGSAKDLDSLWFAVHIDEKPPSGIRVILNDRLCNRHYTSNLVPITPGDFGSDVSEDLEITSGWAGTPPIIDGAVSSSEWNGAGSLSLYDTNNIKRGSLFALNDRNNLYLLLDMTGDDTAGSNPNDDYSGISFDIDMDGYKSPYRDLRFATLTNTENLGIQWVVSQLGWTGVNTNTNSTYAEGFGPGPKISTDHKIFEYKISLAEIEIDFDQMASSPENLFQARLSILNDSSAPDFTCYYPSSYSFYNQPMINVALSMGALEVDAAAPIISGIGLIPRTYIDQTTGLATTGPGHQVNVTNAPFGSHLRFIGNLDKVRSQGVTNYIIGYCDLNRYACNGVSSGSFNLDEWKFVEDVWTNYYWDSSQDKYVLSRVSPALLSTDPVIKAYPTPSGAKDWYINNLLFDWRTTQTPRVESSLYKVSFFGFNGGGLIENSMVVNIDNTPPVFSINSIQHNGMEVDTCGIIQLSSISDDLEINYTAHDPNEYLKSFQLRALYGDNQSFSFHPEINTYTEYLDLGHDSTTWTGAYPSETINCQGNAGDHWNTTCGYTFHISGWDRTTTGYTERGHYRSAHKTITILLPAFHLQ